MKVNRLYMVMFLTPLVVLAWYIISNEYINQQRNVSIEVKPQALLSPSFMPPVSKQARHAEESDKSHAALTSEARHNEITWPEVLDLDTMSEQEISFMYDEIDQCLQAVSEEKIAFESPYDRLTRLGYDTNCLIMSKESLQALRKQLLNSGKMNDLKKVLKIEASMEAPLRDIRSDNASPEVMEEAYQQLMDILYQYMDVLFYSSNAEAVYKAGEEFAWIRANMIVIYGLGTHKLAYEDPRHPMLYPYFKAMMGLYAGDASYDFKLYALFRYCHLKQWHCQAKIKERFEFDPGFERQYGDLDGYTLFTQVVATPYVVQRMAHLQSITR